MSFAEWAVFVFFVLFLSSLMYVLFFVRGPKLESVDEDGLPAEWFAFLDDERVLPLGRHQHFDGADEAATKLVMKPEHAHVLWMFTRQSLERFTGNAQEAMVASRKAEQV